MFHLALRAIADEGAGILLYEHQERRGIGLMEKLRAYELQDQGLDTIEANLRLGHAIDLRDYVLAVNILRFLDVHSLRLMTNNPEKINAVLSSGIGIVERLSADVPGSPHSAHYLAPETRPFIRPVAHIVSDYFPITDRFERRQKAGALMLRTGATHTSDRRGSERQMDDIGLTSLRQPHARDELRYIPATNSAGCV
jgi:hypothetical protein